MKILLHILLLVTCTSIYGQSGSTTEYFRHLMYNHISPYAELTGIHNIDHATAKLTSHYAFTYDASGRIIEIINNHYHTEKKHPLASLGVYRLVVEYSPGQETRTFFDPNGKRISNDRNVYKEVFTYNENQFKSGLKFYDLKDALMESNWKIAEYKWEAKGDLVIERRYNSAGEMVNVSPYFAFGVTAMTLDNKGLPVANYNLNDKLEVANNPDGVASYRDSYDELGNHIKYSYYNENDSLTLNQWQFAVGKKSYDEQGNNILLEQLDTDGKLIRTREVPTNTAIEMSPVATPKDSADIRKQSLGYLKALQQLDPILMNEVMNDSLNKVTIGWNRNIRKEIAKATTRSKMMAFAEDWNKSNTKFPPTPNDQVTILGIYNRIASVQLVSDNWFEYLHLIKLDGKWEIVNLIWHPPL